jgi:demethylmenaquinone methyltransferase / 2-methoxy-6-polyprenyl-1,4-benzoquinol methylase
MVDQIVPSSPGCVLDVAAGTAGVSIQLAQRTPAHVVGIDLTEAMLREGLRRVANVPVGLRVDLVAGRAEQLPFADDTFDGLSFTYLLRYVADPAATLRELVRVMQPGAPIASLEFLVPGNPFWHFWWWLYTRLALPVAGGLAGRDWFEVGRFLGPSISKHYRRYPVDWTIAAWRAAGITDVAVREMSLGGGLVMWGKKAGA